MDRDERRKWIEAMDVEISDLIEREAFQLVSRDEPLGKDKQIVKSMWTFRRKRKPDGTVS